MTETDTLSGNEGEDARIPQRLGRLETGFATLEKGQEGLAVDLGKLTKVVERLAENVGASKRTDWGTLAVWLGILLTIFGITVSSIMTDLSRVEASAEKSRAKLEHNMEVLSEKFVQHRIENATTCARIDELQRRIVVLEGK